MSVEPTDEMTSHTSYAIVVNAAVLGYCKRHLRNGNDVTLVFDCCAKATLEVIEKVFEANGRLVVSLRNVIDGKETSLDRLKHVMSYGDETGNSRVMLSNG